MRFLLGLLALLCILAIAAVYPPLALAIFFAGVLVTPFSYAALAVNPALPATYNADSPSLKSVAFGCQDVSIATASGGGSVVVFVTEGCTFGFSSKWIVTNNSAARPNKQAGIPEVPEADLELQLPAGTTALPYQFSEFTLDPAVGATTYTFIVAEVKSAVKNDGSASKVTIRARYKLN